MTDKVESYHPNNKKGGFTNSSSKPYTLNPIQYQTPPIVNEGSPLVSQNEKNYPTESCIDIGGVRAIVDYRHVENLDYFSMWGNILCFSQLVLGSFLYLSCGMDSYFILTTIAIISHTISCSLGLYGIAQKHIILILNYTIYAFLIVGVNIAVFILSIIAMKDHYPWFLFISALIILNIQFFGLRYIISLALLLRDLQNREIHTSISNAPNPSLISQPTQQYQVYPDVNTTQPQQPQQYYYYTKPLNSNNNNNNTNLSYKL